MTDSYRINVYFTKKQGLKLSEMADSRKQSIAETIRSALSLLRAVGNTDEFDLHLKNKNTGEVSVIKFVDTF